MIIFRQKSTEPLRIPEEHTALLRQMRGQCAYLQITISPVFPERTMPQNAIFHAKINEIAAETGEDRNTIKSIVKDFAMSRGYPYRTDESGNPVTTKDGQLVPKPTSKATIEEMTVLIDALYEWAFENDIYLARI